jgi:cytochrome P450
LKTTYGYQVEPQKPDAVVSLIEKMMTNFSFAAAPGAWLVDLVPALQHLPENFPGAGFKKTARRFRKDVDDGVHIPYHFARRQMANQNGEESFVSRLIRQCGLDSNGKGNLSAEDEHAIVWSAASLYGAAADTTVITLTAFTLAMIQFPEVQRKAQEEIDAVVGTDRLPTFDDQEKLPYINAVIKEALRWWPIAPMGFPHTADAEVEYGDYRIPKGALILPAVWWFMHDPQVYADPDSFEPERFMEPRNEPDPMTETFGYGRRICPGRFYAEAGLFLNMAYSLACFDIKKAIGPDGREIMPEVKASPGVLHHLTKFPFRIEPRSEKHVEMIKRIELDLPVEEGDAELLGLAGT